VCGCVLAVCVEHLCDFFLPLQDDRPEPDYGIVAELKNVGPCGSLSVCECGGANMHRCESRPTKCSRT
jgi:hypothetical protein